MQRKRKTAKHTHHCQEYYMGFTRRNQGKNIFCSGLTGLLLSICLATPLPLVLSHWMIWTQGSGSQGRPQPPYKTLYPRDPLWVQYPCAYTGPAQNTLHDETQWIFILNDLCFMLPREVSFKQECGLPGLSRRFSACSATSVQVVGSSQLAPAHESQRSTSLPNSCSRLHLGSLK